MFYLPGREVSLSKHNIPLTVPNAWVATYIPPQILHPRETGRKINNFMGLAVLEAPEETVNNTLWMGGSPVIGPKVAHQAPACGE